MTPNPAREEPPMHTSTTSTSTRPTRPLVSIVRATGAALAITLVTACSSSGGGGGGGGAPKLVGHDIGDRYVGQWRSDSGATVSIQPAADGNYLVTVNRTGQDRLGQSRLIDVDGTPVVMVKLVEPTSKEREAGSVPVYHFGILTAQAGNTLRHTPIRPEWLRDTIHGKGQARYIDSSSVAQGTGLAVVEDWNAMETILRKAISSPDATGETEVFRRVK